MFCAGRAGCSRRRGGDPGLAGARGRVDPAQGRRGDPRRRPRSATRRRRWRRSPTARPAAVGAAAAQPGPPPARRGGRGDRPVQLPADPRHPRRSPRRWPWATPSCSSPTRAPPSPAGVVIARVFEEAGLPPGLLHVLPGRRATSGEALVGDPHVRVISFTGSTGGRPGGRRAGRPAPQAGPPGAGRQQRARSSWTTPTSTLAASAGAWGSFLHQGQICMTTGRHLVHERIAEEYVERLAAKADHLPVGDPATGQVALGPIIDDEPAGPRPRVGDGERRRRRPAGGGRHLRGPVLPAHGAGRRHPRAIPAYARRCSARSRRS